MAQWPHDPRNPIVSCNFCAARLEGPTQIAAHFCDGLRAWRRDFPKSERSTVSSVAATPEPPPVPNSGPAPFALMITGSANQPLVTITRDGRLEYGEGYDPDAAARIFWEALAANDCRGAELLRLRTALEAVVAWCRKAEWPDSHPCISIPLKALRRP